FTAQPLTYFVRSLGLESSFHSRLARSTILSKINHELRLSGSLSTFDRSASADLSSKPAVSISLALDLGPKAQGLRASQRLETNLLILARLAAARQLASRATVDLFGTAAALRFWLLAFGFWPFCQPLPSVCGTAALGCALSQSASLDSRSLQRYRSRSPDHRIACDHPTTRAASHHRRQKSCLKDQLWRSFNPSGTQGSRILPRRISWG